MPDLPQISVVVPSHDRPLRLRWLLNALEEQTLEPDAWELVVVHDSRAPDTQALLDSHPIRRRVDLRVRRLEPGTGTAARQRNVGWRMATAPLVAFTDDDCRPEPGWLAALLEEGRRSSGAIVQGAVRPDPYETELLKSPYARTLRIDPPSVFGETANILYPADVLERVGGFDELFANPGGEDTDLLWRARELGARQAAAPGAVVNHAVEAFTAIATARRAHKWGDLPGVAKRHPELRAMFPLGRFWRPSHARLALALAGGIAGRRLGVVAALAAIPYLQVALFRGGPRPRGRLRAVAELPGRVVVDSAELVALARGSIRHRTLFL